MSFCTRVRSPDPKKKQLRTLSVCLFVLFCLAKGSLLVLYDL